MWKRADILHTSLPDIKQTILEDFANCRYNYMEWFVACDSQVKGKTVTFTKSIIVHYFHDSGTGAGGRVYVENVIEPFRSYGDKARFADKQRLISEARKSIEVAEWLNPILETLGYEYVIGKPGDPEDEILRLPTWQVKNIHADVHSSKLEFSNAVAKEVCGLIRAHGFEPIIKPHAWAASTVADKFTK